mgnify:CR=1 FL=1
MNTFKYPLQIEMENIPISGYLILIWGYTEMQTETISLQINLTD